MRFYDAFQVLRSTTVVLRAARFFSDGRPFRVLGVQQIAVGGLNKAELSNFWVTGLGIEKVGTYKSEVTISTKDQAIPSILIVLIV
ncbi:hypothetical protein EON65_32635 [archaeon]|nr:MAG: hypothetical protein EON65_32635 [archaeon]